MMIVDNKFKIGDIVYVITDIEQETRMITAIILRTSGYIEYELSLSSTASIFNEIEISKNKIFTI